MRARNQAGLCNQKTECSSLDRWRCHVGKVAQNFQAYLRWLDEVREIPQTGSLEIRRQHLFSTYIDRMFQRKRVNQKYPREKTVQWLSWLAQRMSKTSQSILLIEQMQPSWLQSKAENMFYRLGTILAGILVISLILFLGTTLDLGNTQLNHANAVVLNIFAWGLVLFGYFGISTVEIKTFETLT